MTSSLKRSDERPGEIIDPAEAASTASNSHTDDAFSTSSMVSEHGSKAQSESSLLDDFSTFGPKLIPFIQQATRQRVGSVLSDLSLHGYGLHQIHRMDIL